MSEVVAQFLELNCQEIQRCWMRASRGEQHLQMDRPRFHLIPRYLLGCQGMQRPFQESFSQNLINTVKNSYSVVRDNPTKCIKGVQAPNISLSPLNSGEQQLKKRTIYSEICGFGLGYIH